MDEAKRKKSAGKRLLRLIRRGSVTPDVWEDLEKGRIDTRRSTKVLVQNLSKDA